MKTFAYRLMLIVLSPGFVLAALATGVVFGISIAIVYFGELWQEASCCHGRTTNDSASRSSNAP
jgi:hypothetical protein